MQHTFKVGDRIKLLREVERFPDFIAPKGMTGTVCTIDSDSQGGAWAMTVKMDETIAGCEDWNNEIHWHDDYANDIADDIALIEGN